MTEIYFVRHGQSEANVLDLFAGQSGYALSPLGHRQAEKTAAFLADVTFDAVISSDLPRAFQTAEPIAVSHCLPLLTDMRLREIHAGAWEGVPFSDIAVHHAEAAALWLSNIGLSGCPGGEKVIDVMNRVAPAVAEIAAAYDGKRICIVSHATALRVLECAWNGLPPERMQEIPWLSNASVSVWQYDSNTGTKTCIFRDKNDYMGDMVTALPENI